MNLPIIGELARPQYDEELELPAEFFNVMSEELPELTWQELQLIDDENNIMDGRRCC